MACGGEALEGAMAPESAENGKTALVTGASSGIGAELTRQIASDGYDIVLTARREDRLNELSSELEDRYGVSTTVIPKDLSEPDAPVELFESVQETGVQINTLVNNAGFPVYGRFDETPLEDELAMMQVNMTALTHLTKLYIQPMIDRGDGAILNTASLAAFYSIPRVAVYAATKAYVLSFSEALAHEFKDEGIRVTALCPGPVDTEFMETGNIDKSQAVEGSMYDPTSVAAAGWKGLKGGDRVVRPGLKIKALSRLPRILPRKGATSMVANIFEPKQE